MRISDVVIYEVTGRYNGPEFPPGDRQAKQADVYPEFNRQEAPAAPVAGQTVTAFYVEVQTDEGGERAVRPHLRAAGVFHPL